MVIKNKSNKIGVNKKKGFTLIEIIVAVTIIIILSALAVPKVSGYISKAKEANVISMSKQIYNAAMWSYSQQGNTFDADKIEAAVTSTTNIKATEIDTTVNTADVNITFKNNDKDYTIVILKDDNTYVVNNKDGSELFSSAKQ